MSVESLHGKRVIMQLKFQATVNNMQKAKPQWHCSKLVNRWGLAVSYLLDDKSVNETKRNKTSIK